ncbi:hypothetical protein [Flavobacterium sp. NKUCC04_CG]|uniref:hypothetical protein n=1 Tax=Flavobacterium sp. NKUCC04_CG TaxID=2842121 RepID=UPI001C5B0C68|nr:hypothetical protein [Flavobacterium sp. NKUCC04_CG]MBW3520069.1 hypothetical protein [Flavobacterium sp. NKUCC04_CG]
MKKILFVLAVLSVTYSCAIAQNTKEKTSKKAEVAKTEKNKTVEKDNVCLLTDNDEIRSFADGKITHPSSIPRIKKDISKLTSCAIANIKIISGKDSGNTAEYIACVCGTKMIFKADYSMNIKTVTEL